MLHNHAVRKAERTAVVSDVTMIRLFLHQRVEQETMLYICGLEKDIIPHGQVKGGDVR